MKKINNRFFLNIVFPSIFVFIIFVLMILWLILPRIEHKLIEKRKETVKELVNTVCSLLDEYNKEVEEGLLSLDEAKKRSCKRVGNMRYGDDNKDYFWITDTVPIMIFHPYLTELNGENLSQYADSQGNKLFMEAKRIAFESGQGYLSYLWQWKDDTTRIVSKISYIRLFSPWGWIVGSGVYIDDIKLEIVEIREFVLMVSGLVALVILVILVFIVNKSFKTEKAKQNAINMLLAERDYNAKITEITPVSIMSINKTGKIVFINRQAQLLFGLSKNELLSRSFNDLKWNITDWSGLKIEDKDLPFARVKKELLSLYDIQHRIKKGDQYLYLSVNTSPLLDERGDFNGVVNAIVDVTEQINNEKLVKQSKDRLNRAIIAGNMAWWEYDVMNNKIVSDKELLTLLLFKELPLTLNDFCNTVVTNDLERVLDSFNDLILGNTSTIEIEYQVSNNEEEPKWVHNRAQVVEYNQRNQAVRIAGIVHDITARKQMENKITLSERRFRGLIENSMDLIFTMDANGRFLYVSPSFESVLHIKTKDFIGTSFVDWVHPEDRLSVGEQLSNALLNEESCSFECFRFALADCQWNYVNSKLKPIHDDGKLLYYFGMASDITRIKQVESMDKEMQYMRKTAEFKQQFLANMSHEMRTPMNGIIGITEILSQTELQPKQKEYLDIIKSSAEVLLSIINDVLDISKIEAGKLVINYEIISIKEIMEQVNSIFHSLVRKKNLTFSINLAPELPKYIYIDKKRLLQVLNNLISNAVKFSENGTIEVNVQLVSRKDNDVVIRMDVMDSGIGIAKSQMEVLFNKFQQLDGTLTRKTEGTGLGLYISKQLVHILGGEIGVESQLGEGSRFWFTIKAEVVERKEKEATKENLDEIKTLGLNVLVVEDKLINQKVIELMLGKFGCKVIIANDGEEAITLFETNTFDIVFMDIQMPVMDGITATKILKQKYGKQLPPIIGLSANSMEGDAERFISMGLDDYLPKPVMMNSLFKKIVQWVSA